MYSTEKFENSLLRQINKNNLKMVFGDVVWWLPAPNKPIRKPNPPSPVEGVCLNPTSQEFDIAQHIFGAPVSKVHVVLPQGVLPPPPPLPHHISTKNQLPMHVDWEKPHFALALIYSYIYLSPSAGAYCFPICLPVEIYQRPQGITAVGRGDIVSI